LVVFKGVFFFPDGEFEIINSSKMFMDRAKKMVDADFAKKIETDALTKALSKLGFNADVFMGRFDDTKYVLEMKKEFAPVDVEIEQIKSMTAQEVKDNWGGLIASKWSMLDNETVTKLNNLFNQ